MQSLEFVDVSESALRAITERHGLGVHTFGRLPQIGVINAIYALGDRFVLRVPRAQPSCVAQARAEAIAARVARAAGVRTPRLIVFEEAGDLLPVPYLIFERVPGRTLGLLNWEPAPIAAVWWELGGDLALLHSIVPAMIPPDELPAAQVWPDPRELAEERASDGWITELEVRWLSRWLDRIAVSVAAPVPPHLLHLDVQAANIMVDEHSLTYRALLDARWRELRP